MGTKRVVRGVNICHDGNIDIIILNTSLAKTNIYLGGVAMFSLHTIKNNINIAVYKI